MSDDSLQNRKVFPEVVKEVTKTNIKGKMFIPISEIGDSLLLQLRPQQVDEVLTMLPSLYIQNYGGFGGMKSISIRGTSSSQSVLMIEGIRINSTQNGMVDVSTIPVSMLQSIEVTRTGSSALYGANAIGGAINFRLQNSSVQKPSIILDRSSFDTYSATSSFGFEFGEVTTNISLNGLSSRGKYPFQHNEFGTTTTIQRENGDFQQYSGMASSTYSPSLITSISALYLTTATERGVPGAVVQGSIEFKNARLQENNHFVTLIGKTLLLPSVQNESKLWFRNNFFLYTDPDATLLGANGLSAKYNSLDIGFQSTFTQSLGNSTLEYQIEMISTTLEGFSLEDGETIKPNRNTFSISSNYTSPILDFYRVPIQIFTGLRYDIISDQDNALSPLFSLLIPFSENVKIRTSYSYNYRPPTFNEMYYLNYGNQNLLSERSHSTTIGIDANLASFFDFSFDVFSIHTANLIVSVPISPVSWSAQNIGTAVNNGIEFSSKISLFDHHISLKTTLTLQNVRDRSPNSFTYDLRIPYTPNILSSAQLISTFDNFSAGLTYLYSGNRFSLAGNQIESLLPFFHTVSTFIEYKARLFPLLVHSRIQVDNFFDYSYTVIRNFPVPGRSFRLNIGVTWL